MVGRGSPAGGKLHSNFVGLKFIINCFSLSHIIWWVFFIWLAITVFGRHHGCTDQNFACKREVKWWQKAMHNMKLLCCIYERLFFMKIVLFLTFPRHAEMELLYISNERCNNWLRLLEKYVSTLLLTILYAVTTFSGSVFCLLTCFDWCFPYHY